MPMPQPSDYTKGLSREAISLLFKFLTRSYKNGPNDYLVGAGWCYPVMDWCTPLSIMLENAVMGKVPDLLLQEQS